MQHESKTTHVIEIDGTSQVRVVLTKFAGYQGCDAGTLEINGDYGPWEHTWSSTGSRSFGEFLSGLDMEYAMGKLAGQSIYKYDPEGTQLAVRGYIIICRQEGDWSKEAARRFWEHTEHLAKSSDVYQAYTGPSGDVLREELFAGQPIVITRVTDQAQFFWVNVWPRIVAAVLALEKIAEAA